MGDVWRPGTLNRYAYVRNNPVNLGDPSGLQEPEPSPAPSPEPNIGNRIRYGLADELARDFGIQVLSKRVWPVFRASALEDWRHDQLHLVIEAAGDFADLMQGTKAAFRARIGGVGLIKAPGKLVLPGGRVYAPALCYPPIYLSGDDADWQRDGGLWMKGVVVHELAHAWDFRTGGRLSAEMVATGFWTHTECRIPTRPWRLPEDLVHDWNADNQKRPNLNPMEDWADSVSAYVYPKRAKAISRSRWRYVGQQMDPHNWWNDHFYPTEWRGLPFYDFLVEGGQIVERVD